MIELNFARAFVWFIVFALLGGVLKFVKPKLKAVNLCFVISVVPFVLLISIPSYCEYELVEEHIEVENENAVMITYIYQDNYLSTQEFVMTDDNTELEEIIENSIKGVYVKVLRGSEVLYRMDFSTYLEHSEIYNRIEEMYDSWSSDGVIKKVIERYKFLFLYMDCEC